MRVLLCVAVLYLSLQGAFPHVTEHPENCPFEGCMGEKGERGPSGLQGSKGEGGLPSYCNCSGGDVMSRLLGLPGEKGEAGVSGRAGLPGKRGVKGDSGEPGVAGPKGEPGVPGTCPAVDNRTCAGIVGPPGTAGEKGEPGTPAIPPPTIRPVGSFGALGASRVEVMSMISSESCSLDSQGTLRLDPNTKQLYYCDGDQWTCLETTVCREPPCVSPYGPAPVGGMWYQAFLRSVTQDNQDAADVVLIVDESGSMNREHEWLLIMIPLLEQVLVQAGVGVGARNRYCVVGFGGFEDFEGGHFILVDGEPCFLASDFPRARDQLRNAGLYEDGYQAIDFALKNIPFRDSPFIAKNIILITDEGRTPIPLGAGLNFTDMERLLKDDDVLLNVVAWADYRLRDDPNAVVLGVDYSGVSYVLEPNGGFSVKSGPVEITGAEKDTAESYVDLAIAVGGASWALRILRESSISRNVTLQESFTSALTEIKVKEISAQIESCRKCTCVAGEVTTRIRCEIADDADFCQCVVVNNGDQSQCTPSELLEIRGGDEDLVFGAGGGTVASSSDSFSIPRAASGFQK